MLCFLIPSCLKSNLFLYIFGLFLIIKRIYTQKIGVRWHLFLFFIMNIFVIFLIKPKTLNWFLNRYYLYLKKPKFNFIIGYLQVWPIMWLLLNDIKLIRFFGYLCFEDDKLIWLFFFELIFWLIFWDNLILLTFLWFFFNLFLFNFKYKITWILNRVLILRG